MILWIVIYMGIGKKMQAINYFVNSWLGYLHNPVFTWLQQFGI